MTCHCSAYEDDHNPLEGDCTASTMFGYYHKYCIEKECSNYSMVVEPHGERHGECALVDRDDLLECPVVIGVLYDTELIATDVIYGNECLNCGDKVYESCICACGQPIEKRSWVKDKLNEVINFIPSRLTS